MGLKFRQYVLVGNENSWKIGLNNKIWGFKETNYGLWNKTREGEFLMFYVTSPISKIIGVGQVEKKYIDDLIVWPEEKFANRSLWKYKFKLKILKTVSYDNGISKPNDLMLNVGRKVLGKNQFLSLLQEADKKWKSNLTEIFQKSDFKN